MLMQRIIINTMRLAGNAQKVKNKQRTITNSTKKLWGVNRVKFNIYIWKDIFQNVNNFYI